MKTGYLTGRENRSIKPRASTLRSSPNKLRKRIRASQVVAKLFRQIEVAANRRHDSPELQSFRLWYVTKMLEFLQVHIRRLSFRLSWAFLDSKNARMICDTAYGRSLLIDSHLEAELFSAERMHDDQRRFARLKTLQRKWNAIDKGRLGRSKTGIEALALLRKWYAYRSVADRLGPKQRVEFEHRVLEPIIRSLNRENAELFSAIAKAHEFRKTDEHNVDRRLAEFGALARLAGKKNVGLAKMLREQRAPDWTGDMSDFRKKLTRCLVPWTRGRAGRPARKKSGVPPIKKSPI